MTIKQVVFDLFTEFVQDCLETEGIPRDGWLEYLADEEQWESFRDQLIGESTEKDDYDFPSYLHVNHPDRIQEWKDDVLPLIAFYSSMCRKGETADVQERDEQFFVYCDLDVDRKGCMDHKDDLIDFVLRTYANVFLFHEVDDGTALLELLD